MSFGQNGGVTESLLTLTTKRAMAIWGGLDSDYEGGGLAATLTMAKLIPKTGRLAAFICTWAVVMAEEGYETLSPEVYAARGLMSRASTYRRLQEYKELWGSVMTIDEMGRRIIASRPGGAPVPKDPGAVRLPGLEVIAVAP